VPYDIEIINGKEIKKNNTEITEKNRKNRQKASYCTLVP
jgi:hypothetical protein